MLIDEYIHELQHTLASIESNRVNEILFELADIYKQGGKLVVFGNGGSAADAQHIVAELVSSFENRRRQSFPALALTVNTSNITAIGNDYDFKSIFSRQVQSLVTSKDAVLALSTSGKSPNVIEAVKQARINGAKVIGFTGQNGGELASLCDYCIKIPNTTTSHIQECHIAIAHYICRELEKLLTNKDLRYGKL